jgi:hypothetical protein
MSVCGAVVAYRPLTTNAPSFNSTSIQATPPGLRSSARIQSKNQCCNFDLDVLPATLHFALTVKALLRFAAYTFTGNGEQIGKTNGPFEYGAILKPVGAAPYGRITMSWGGGALLKLYFPGVGRKRPAPVWQFLPLLSAFDQGITPPPAADPRRGGRSTRTNTGCSRGL